METVEDVVKRAIHELAVGTINDGVDYLGIELYDEDGNDLSENEEWRENFLKRLWDYVHSAYPPERDWWAIETGKAQILLRLKNILEIEIDEDDERILMWLADLFH